MNYKIRTLREKLKNLNLEGMIVTNPVNIKYLTNIESEGILLITRKENIFLTYTMFIEDVKRRKDINDQLDKDIVTIIQPLITKYSNLNREYKSSLSEEDYAQKRLEMNKSLESELKENLPYLESREIKKIVIDFNREQDKIN